MKALLCWLSFHRWAYSRLRTERCCRGCGRIQFLKQEHRFYGVAEWTDAGK